MSAQLEHVIDWGKKDVENQLPRVELRHIVEECFYFLERYWAGVVCIPQHFFCVIRGSGILRFSPKFRHFWENSSRAPSGVNRAWDGVMEKSQCIKYLRVLSYAQLCCISTRSCSSKKNVSCSFQMARTFAHRR